MVDFPASGTQGLLSRRSLLRAGAAGMAGVFVSGCDANSSAEEDTPEPAAELAPDVAVATTALAEIRAVRVAVASTRARFPAQSQLASLVETHQAHEESLADAVPARARSSATPAPYVVPRQREAALRKLATTEQRLHDTLDGLAIRAQSGDFARLLASMGAAVSQHLAVWSS